MNIADLRKDYKVASLAEKDVAASPFIQFEKWLNEAIAAELPEPNAMTLATVGSAVGGDTRPSTRIVLIKEFDARGPVWFTNYQSRKGRELAENNLPRFNFTGWNWSAWCESRARLKRLATPIVTPILIRGRSIRALARGPRHKAK